MRIIACVSDDFGLLFNMRRQSRDRRILEDISTLVGDAVLYINDFSIPLFDSAKISVLSVTDPLKAAGSDDFVFVENMSVLDFKDKIEEVILYKWNRKYPADFKLDLEPSAEGMSLCESIDFVGHSHEKITREIWRPENKL